MLDRTVPLWLVIVVLLVVFVWYLRRLPRD